MGRRRNSFNRVYLALLLLVLVFLSAFKYPKRVRVAIVKDGKSIKLTFPKACELAVYPETNKTKELKQQILNNQNQKIEISHSSGNSFLINGAKYTHIDKIILKNPLQKSYIKVNGRPYRGNITIIFGDQIYVINDLPLEQYVYGVLPGEISPRWPMEAIKAQAVAARTYVVYVVNERNTDQKYFDVDATTNFQVYKGAYYEAERTNRAVDFTRGEIMLYQNEPVQAYFHSICGGYTEDARDVWGQNLPYLRSVRCDYCKIAPDYYWKYKVKKEHLAKLLNIGEIKQIKLHKGKRQLRVRSMTFITNTGVFKFEPKKLRQLFGENKFRSNIFNVQITDDYVIFKGQGFGHGVGLCQWGAYGMAKKGRTYKDILRYYYHNITFRKFYEDGSF